MTSLKEIASSCVDNSKDDLYQLSNEIWQNPELGSKEYKAHDLLTNFLEKKGFTVERSFTGIKTAFRATFGSGRPNVCVICEYDALPEIGHACGHNLIAEAGIAAGLGLKAVLESPNAPKGMVTVMGTPDEEGSGGKVDMIENSAFKDVDIAMMVHPAPFSVLKPQHVTCVDWQVTYIGKAAHAAAFPWEGMNALDAAVMAYTSISVLRQQMKPTERVHAIISNGGAKPNIIPEKAEMQYMIRAETTADAKVLFKKVKACWKAAATATRCQMELKQTAAFYNDVQSNEMLVRLFKENNLQLGMDYLEFMEGAGSTDMGNVSYVVPSIHPLYKIGSGETNHTREFTQVSNTPEAHSETLTAAKAMAHTCIDVLTTDGLLEEIKKKFTAHED